MRFYLCPITNYRTKSLYKVFSNPEKEDSKHFKCGVNVKKLFNYFFGKFPVQIYQIFQSYNQYQMSRKFLRPLFSFWEPFNSDIYISKKAIPGGVKAKKMYEQRDQKKHDPNETFDNFFKDYYENTNSLKVQEKEFFEKHYPERVGKKFNPFEALGVDKNADLEKIKEAYRSNAIKYHPKNNQSEDAQRKFNQLARAYNELTAQKQAELEKEESSQSLFQDFHSKIENFDQHDAEAKDSKDTKQKQGSSAQSEGKQKQQGKLNSQTEQKKDESKTWQKDSKQNEQSGSKENNKKEVEPKSQERDTKQFLKGAQLYSQSSYFEFIDGKRKLHVTKMYQKDGKTLKVDRIEDQKPDGTIEVTETLDDGRQVKNKKYIQGASKKHKQIGN